MKRVMISTAITMVLCLGQVSCRQPEVVYQETVTEAESLAKQGDSKQAVATLKRLFDKRRFASYRPTLLSMMLQVDLNAGDVAGAQRLFQDAAGRDVAAAGSAVGLIEDYLSNRGRHEELVTWCVALQQYKFIDDVAARLGDRHLRTLAMMGKPAAVPAALAPYLKRLPEGPGLDLAQAQFGLLAGADKLVIAREIAAVVEKTARDTARRGGVLLSMNVDLRLAAQDRAGADQLVRSSLAVTDDSVIRNATEVARAHQAAGESTAADALPLFILGQSKARPAVREAMAVLWLKLAAQRASATELVRRLATLKDDGFSARFILDQTDGVYSLLLEHGTKQDFEPLYALFMALNQANHDEVLRRRIVGVLLDVGFYLEKFEDALNLVATTLPPSEGNQKALLTAKIKAHLALQQGKPHEAVAQFREFMALIARGTETEVDPVDNSRTTKDMILGLNARRIGDILVGAGDKTGATGAYREARQFYTKALAEFPDAKSLEHRKIQKQLAEIPNGG